MYNQISGKLFTKINCTIYYPENFILNNLVDFVLTQLKQLNNYNEYKMRNENH